MNYEKLILNKLLDKYEKSKSYKQETNRRILMKVTEIKEYNIENVEEKQLFHDALDALKNLKLIDYSWKKYEDGNIVEEIWLEKENIILAYEKAERCNIKSEAFEIKETLDKTCFTNEWLNNFKEDIIEEINIKEKENSILPYSYYKEIIQALKIIDLKGIWLERTFSIKCFGDSKYFEKNIKKYIIRIIKKYLLQIQMESIQTKKYYWKLVFQNIQRLLNLMVI